MRKIIISIYSVFLLLFLFISFKFIINVHYLNNYKNGVYKLEDVKPLKFLNLYQSYIAYYNYGNVLYKLGNYNEAVDNYNLALEKNPKKDRICKIRINKSLSLIAPLKEENSNYEDVLNEALDNLYEDDCAHEKDDNGRSQEAEKLEAEIKELLENKTEEKEEDEEEKEDTDTKEQEEKRQTLKEINKNANKNRQEDLETYKNIYNYEYYSGKSW